MNIDSMAGGEGAHCRSLTPFGMTRFLDGRLGRPDLAAVLWPGEDTRLSIETWRPIEEARFSIQEDLRRDGLRFSFRSWFILAPCRSPPRRRFILKPLAAR